MTETAGFFILYPAGRLTGGSPNRRRTGSQSLMRAIRPDGTWAVPGETGELVIKGEAVIKGYMNQEDNENAFIEGAG